MVRRVKRGDIIKETDYNALVDFTQNCQTKNREFYAKLEKPNPTIEGLLREIDLILARMRRVKYGDFVLASDHNVLVDFAEKQDQLNAEFSARLDELKKYEEITEFLVTGLPQEVTQTVKAKPVDRVIENSLKQTVTAKPVDQTCTQSLTQTCTAEKVV